VYITKIPSIGIFLLLGNLSPIIETDPSFQQHHHQINMKFTILASLVACAAAFAPAALKVRRTNVLSMESRRLVCRQARAKPP
jgi:hypothetical protein